MITKWKVLEICVYWLLRSSKQPSKTKGKKSWQMWGYKCSVKESTEQTGMALVVRDALCLPVLVGILQLPLRY